jgi:hypothetical protein
MSRNIFIRVQNLKEIFLQVIRRLTDQTLFFYEKGKVNYITLSYREPKNIMHVLSNLELQRKVFQYDKCGNLRNISEIMRYTGQIKSCYDYYYSHLYLINDNILVKVECAESWRKPFILY